MEITDFLSQSFLSTFPGTLVAVELIVFATKGFPLIKKIPTRLYTFILALAHYIIMLIMNGKFTLEFGNFYIAFLNTLVVTVTLCGGYDVMIGNVNLSLINNVAKKITSEVTGESKVSESDKNSNNTEVQDPTKKS